MKPVQQTIKGPNGDCLRACIASLLEYPIEKVPNFMEAPELQDSEYPSWWVALQSWLNERGLFFLEMHLPPNMPFMPLPIPALCIFFGQTEAGVKHAIVGRLEGNQFHQVFNPWPEAEINGVGALGFLIPRDPVLPVDFGRSMERLVKMVRRLPDGPIVDEMKTEIGKCLGYGLNGVKIHLPDGSTKQS